jgi:3'-5' exoribonuclease
MDQKLLKDIPQEADYPIAHLLRISDMSLKETKSGKFYVAFTAGDKSRDLSFCKKWDSSEDEFERLKKHQILFVTGKTDVWNDNLSIVAETLAVPEDALPPETFQNLMKSTAYNLNTLKKEVWKFIQNMEDPFIKKLCVAFIKDPYVKERLGTWPAAKGVHHAYRSGLITHIYRLMVHADSFVDTCNSNLYPGATVKVNKDMVMAGCLLHDLYKISEYNEDISYAKSGQLIDHLLEGAIEANRKMDQIEGFPEHLRKAITHMIHSHHGEWSVIKPKSPEAIILHHLDYMFARLDPCLENLEERDGEWSKQRVKSIDGFAWVGASLTDGE